MHYDKARQSASTAQPRSGADTATLYPQNLPFNTGMLDVGSHRLYYEQCGNPEGVPVLFLHGGPGAGCAPSHRRLFHPDRFHAILFDQRGSGKSEPYASIHENTTPHLIADIETLRVHLGVDKFILFGGSWGSTLALAYALSHPDRVAGLILRGIFLGSRDEVDWFLYGMKKFYPEAHERFVAPLSPDEKGDILASYLARLTAPDHSAQMRAARHWTAYENSCATLAAAMRDAGPAALSMARIEAHYFAHDCFFDDGYILDNLNRINHLPARIIQGRHDVICPPETAIQLARKWGNMARIELIDTAGHSAFEAGVVEALIHHLEDMALPPKGSI